MITGVYISQPKDLPDYIVSLTDDTVVIYEDDQHGECINYVELSLRDLLTAINYLQKQVQ